MKRASTVPVLLVVSALLCLGPYARCATQIQVKVLEAKDLPALSQDRVAKILKNSARIMAEVCKKDVAFEIKDRKDLDEFLKEEAERVAPYTLSAARAANIATPPKDLIRQTIGENCHSIWRLDDMGPLFADRPGGRPATAEAAADELFDSYMQSLSQLAARKTLDGKPLIQEGNWRRYSLGHWGSYLHSAEWTTSYTLYLSNGLLVEDSVESANPLSLLRGGFVNGVAFPASRSVLVACYGLLDDAMSAGNPHLAGMTETQKDDAIAYLIAQYVGVVLLMDHSNSADAEAGLARLIQFVDGPDSLSNMPALKLNEAKLGDSNMRGSYSFKVALRMEMFLAQGRDDLVIEEAQRRSDPRFDPEMGEYVDELLRRAVE